MSRKVASGVDTLERSGFSEIRGMRVGVLANQAAVNSELVHLVDLIQSSAVATLAALFAPEHGFRGALQDMAEVGHSVDHKTGLEVISLYGSTEASLAPTPEQLKGLDALIVDLPDIGTRYYTFAQSLGYCMKVAAATGTRIVVLDRPNPIDGVTIEGGSLEHSCRSFCGYAPVPQRHGLTIGELGLLMNRGFGPAGQEIPPINCDLVVVKCEGWQRHHYADETGLPWVIPSPNMPTLDTAIVYPGGCLFEATSASEGRGTTRPFEFLGAPGIDPDRWIDAVAKQGLTLEGAKLRSHSFQPKFQKCRDQICNGVQLHITDRKRFRPLRWGLALLASLRRTHPAQCEWRRDAYEFVSNVPAIDLLYGSGHFRDLVDSGRTLEPIEAELTAYEREFKSSREEFLLY